MHVYLRISITENLGTYRDTFQRFNVWLQAFLMVSVTLLNDGDVA